MQKLSPQYAPQEGALHRLTVTLQAKYQEVIADTGSYSCHLSWVATAYILSSSAQLLSVGFPECPSTPSSHLEAICSSPA